MITKVETERVNQTTGTSSTKKRVSELEAYRKKFPQYNAASGGGVTCWDAVKASWLAKDGKIVKISRLDVRAAARNLNINGVYKPSEAALEESSVEQARAIEQKKWHHEISSGYPVVFGLVSGKRKGAEWVLLYGAYLFREALLADKPIKAVLLGEVQTKSVELCINCEFGVA